MIGNRYTYVIYKFLFAFGNVVNLVVTLFVDCYGGGKAVWWKNNEFWKNNELCAEPASDI